MEEYTKSNSALMSDDIRSYSKAFIKARLKMESVSKAQKGNYGRYADINSIYDACVIPLLEEGIYIWHGSDQLDDNREILYTRLIHAESGQWTQDKRVLLCEKNNNQGRGGANTYARKLAVLSLCALGCDDDDCDNEPEIRQQPEAAISSKEVEALEQVINKCANPTKIRSNILGFNKITNLNQLPASKFDSVVSYIAKNSSL
jgi:hypothetical protein